MKISLQFINQWIIENAFNVEAQDGNNYIVIDFKEMQEYFNKLLEKSQKEKQCPILQNSKCQIGSHCEYCSAYIAGECNGCEVNLKSKK